MAGNKTKHVAFVVIYLLQKVICPVISPLSMNGSQLKPISNERIFVDFVALNFMEREKWTVISALSMDRILRNIKISVAFVVLDLLGKLALSIICAELNMNQVDSMKVGCHEISRLKPEVLAFSQTSWFRSKKN